MFCLQLVSEEAPVPIKQGSAADPTVWLDRLAAIFRYVQRAPDAENI